MRYALFSWRAKPIHPDIESLVRYRGCELPADRTKAVARHLRSCPACRLECERLDDTVPSGPDPAAPASALEQDPRLAGVLAGIHSWQAAANAGRGDEGVKHRVAGRVERYLGAPATSKILQSVSGDGGNLLSTVEPVLALFLGSKAASRLVSHVVEAAIVRI